MATVAGIDLGLDRQKFAAGGAFRLSEVSRLQSLTYRNDTGDVAEVHPDPGYVLAFLTNAGDPLETARRAHHLAQEALDVVAFTGRGAATLPRGHDEYTVWLRVGDGVAVSVMVKHEVKVSMSVSAEVRGLDGELRPQPTPPEPRWTPALRFFRLSQVAEDVFDAYRNAFLALEAILSEHVTGGPGGERAWLEHALRDVERRQIVEVARYVKPAPAGDAVQEFLDQQYEGCAAPRFMRRRIAASCYRALLTNVARSRKRWSRSFASCSTFPLRSSRPASAAGP